MVFIELGRRAFEESRNKRECGGVLGTSGRSKSGEAASSSIISQNIFALIYPGMGQGYDIRCSPKFSVTMPAFV